jgi:hypothetical protein
LVGFTISEIKSWTLVKVGRMTKAEETEKAWRHGFRGDFSIVDRIFHQTKFRAFDQGAIYPELEVDLDIMKTIWLSMSETAILGPFRTIYENEEFLCLHFFRKFNGNIPRFQATILHLKYEFDKIVHIEVISQELDYDPSDGHDWNWEDYE